MKTYKVTATRSGKWWALEVAGLKLGHTQARRLSDIEPMVRELISILAEVPEDAFDVAIQVDVPAADTIATADRLRAAADAAKQAAEDATRAAAVALVADDVPVRDVATMLRVSPAWVSVLTRTGK